MTCLPPLRFAAIALFAALSLPLLAQDSDLCIGDNEPYAGHLPGDAIDRHAIQPGRDNTLIEVRNDLIGSESQQQAWAERLERIFRGLQAKLLAMQDFVGAA